MIRKNKQTSLNIKLQRQVVYLEAKVKELSIKLEARDIIKNEALQKYTDDMIALYNSAIRSTGGPKSGETADQYRQRLCLANKGSV
jgi:hypothetical protein